MKIFAKLGRKSIYWSDILLSFQVAF